MGQGWRGIINKDTWYRKELDPTGHCPQGLASSHGVLEAPLWAGSSLGPG